MFKRFFSLGLISGLLFFSYNNCQRNSFETGLDSSAPVGLGSSDGAGGKKSDDLCLNDLMQVYARGYHDFLKNNCAACHALGPGKGRFASANFDDAFLDFQQVGYVKVSSNAVSSTHNPPASGPQHIQTVNLLKLDWQKGLQDFDVCRGEVSVPVSLTVKDRAALQTALKKIPAMNFGEEKEISWQLGSELVTIKSETLPVAPGAMFAVTVGKNKNASGDTYYTIRKPTIYNASVDLHIVGIFGMINSRFLSYPTTFNFVDRNIRSGSLNDVSGLVATGSVIALGALTTEDQISVAFEKLEVVKLPAPKPPVSISFTSPSVQWSPKNGTQFLDFEVSLSEAATDPITVTVSDDSGPICPNLSEPITLGTGCLPDVASFICATSANCAEAVKVGRVRSIVGATYNRFDWDFKFKSSAMTFLPGETKKTVRVTFSSDIRKEFNRLLSLRIDGGLGSVVMGARSKVHVVLDKLSNSTPVVGVPTYTQLMTSGTGILAVNCLECHNSVKREGGYDITNYDEMVSRGVLIPGSTSSKMYKRLNANDPDFYNLTPMPLKGPMEEAYIRAIEKWIINGALNN